MKRRSLLTRLIVGIAIFVLGYGSAPSGQRGGRGGRSVHSSSARKGSVRQVLVKLLL